MHGARRDQRAGHGTRVSCLVKRGPDRPSVKESSSESDGDLVVLAAPLGPRVRAPRLPVGALEIPVYPP